MPVNNPGSGNVAPPYRGIVRVMLRPVTSARILLLVVGLTLALSLGGCSGCVQSGQASIGVMPGVMNDPGNRSLRRAILRFGLEEFCKELTHRGAPLRMRDEDPVMGRFYARSCNHHELESGDVFVQIEGIGYAWTNASLRAAFAASAAIQYNQDFLMDGSTMYAYFRTRLIASKESRVTMVEQTGPLGAGVAAFANQVVPQVVEGQLKRGFTVIRDSDGSVDFTVGMVEKGQRPVKPYEVRDSDRVTMMNERTEVRGNQLDFLGPFHVDDNDGALFLTMSIDGTAAVDVMVVDKGMGDQWLDSFVKSPGVPQPPMPPLMTDVVPKGTQWQKTVPVRRGHYYVVLDNSSVVGSATPVATGSVPSGALVNVVVQVGEAP
jgi:hypothetical protein